MHGERADFNNTEWDMEFMELLEKDPEKLTEITTAEYARLGGWEGAEIIMWLIMRGAMAKKLRKMHQACYLPSMTAIGSLIFENDSMDPEDDSAEDFVKRMNHELAGVEKLEGTYPFTLDTSVRAYRLNRFLHGLIIPAQRAAFLADSEAMFEEGDLTEEERRLVRDLDWRGLIHYGVIFFMLEKLGAVVGTSNLHIYAAMRGESLEDFEKTRNAQALYSVAGQDIGKTDWDKDDQK